MGKCGVALGGLFVFIAFGVFFTVDLFVTRKAVDNAKVKGEVAAADASNGIASSSKGIQKKFADYVNAARTLGLTYENEGITCYDAASQNAKTTAFLQAVIGLQETYGAEFPYTYVSYNIQGSNLWGDCGCQAFGKTSRGTICSYVDRNGADQQFFNGNLNDLDGPSVPASSTHQEGYTYVIKNMTRSNMNGVWHAPYFYSDPRLGVAIEMLTFSLPIAFGADGYCTLAASVDVSLDFVQTYLANGRGVSPNSEAMFLDVRGEGTFVASSQVKFQNAVYPPMKTPNARINNFSTLVYQRFGNTFNKSDHFSYHGMLYQSELVLPNWVIVERSPLSLDTRSIAQSIGEMFVGYEKSAKSLGITYQREGTTCYAAAEQMQSTTNYLQAVRSLQQAYGDNIKYLYVSYEVGSTGNWGDCGCSILASGGIECYYTSRNGTHVNFLNGNFDSTSSTRQNAFVTNEDYIKTIRSMTYTGDTVWHKPTVYNDETQLVSYELIAYSQCLMASLGVCRLATTIDISMKFLRSFLAENKGNKNSEVVFLDGRDPGYFVAGSDQTFNITTTIYDARSTPDAKQNTWMWLVFDQLGRNFQNTTSFTNDGYLYNTQRVGLSPDYTVIERVKAGSDFHLRSVRTVGQLKAAAKNFMDMYTKEQQIGFYAALAFVVLAIIIERIVIVCCCVGASEGSRKGDKLDDYMTPMHHR